jgi:hypothetical protein
MIRLPVSIGEAVDKLTILDIKLQKIQDSEKHAYVQTEFDLLRTELEPYLEDHAFTYARLRDVNLQIWEMQDEIRLRPDPQKCVDILDKNDARFRMKDIINRTAGSAIREQKGYPKRRALFIGHMGLGDHIGLIGAVRYLAMQYDETVVVCLTKNLKNLASIYADNPSIKLFPVEKPFFKWSYETDSGVALVYDPAEFTHVYKSGQYLPDRQPRSEGLPGCFYLDMGLDPAIRHSHFHLPTPRTAKTLYAWLDGRDYVFVHRKSSSHVAPILTWDIHTTLTIDPDINPYHPDHHWHRIAEMFVGKPFLDYRLVLQNAKEIHAVDSSFYCLACYIPLKAVVKRCYARDTGAVISTYDFT